jgi:wobble nucleotide-excising tRNase
MTHNVYFHKEITFNKKRKSGKLKEETFWIIRKTESGSKIEWYNENPITTSYDLLWAEVRNKNKSPLMIQNVLRRILENYFKILGGIDFDSICDRFDGKEKLICKSLFSWVSDGSHFALDDVYISMDNTQIDSYLKVFKNIFLKMNHFEHYKMMMGNSEESEDAANTEGNS